MLLSSWLVFLIIFVAWLLLSIAPAFRKAFEDRLLPADKKRGTSVFPVFPLFPAIFSVIYSKLDSTGVWDEVLVGIHGIILLFALIEVIRWKVRLRKAKNEETNP